MDNVHLNPVPRSLVAIALSMRDSIQSKEIVAAPPCPRVKLAKLPEEMLLRIFQAAHDAPIPEFRRRTEPSDRDLARYNQGTRDIQNIRLTCRDFNRISSELLIKFVGVGLSSESLARFQAIMGHPTIGKGVSMVRVRLPMYEWFLYNSLLNFASRIQQKLRFIAFYASEVDPEAKTLAKQYVTKDLGLRHRSLSGKLLAAVEPRWREYRERYQAEHRIRKEQFVEDITNALLTRNTKRVLRLEITDQYDFIWQDGRSLDLATADNLIDLVSKPQPSPWQRFSSTSNVPRCLAWMLPLIVQAFVDDRIRITDLYFDIDTDTSEQLVSTEADQQSLRHAMRNVRSFTYIRHDPLLDDETGTKLSSVFQDCLPSTSLRHLKLVEVRLRPRQFSNLSRISLNYVDFDAESLALLLQPLEPHEVAITLHHCRIVQDSQGSWVDVLDLLRSKQSRTCLDWPSGREFDGPFVPASHLYKEETRWLNETRYRTCVSTAEQYIRGSCDINPLREHQE